MTAQTAAYNGAESDVTGLVDCPKHLEEAVCGILSSDTPAKHAAFGFKANPNLLGRSAEVGENVARYMPPAPAQHGTGATMRL